jgi:hypothetical protein
MRQGYAQRDWEIVDYQQYRLTWRFVARGPAPRRLRRNEYFACVGAAQTFGCFCEAPFPMLLEQRLHLASLNLGRAGAGPRFFSNQRALMKYINRARFVIVQVMSGRSEDNSLFRSGGLEWLQRRSDGVELSAESAYQQLVDQHDRDFVQRVVMETRANWVRSFTELLAAMTPPKILFWFSQRHPEYVERLDSAEGLFGEFPQLVNAGMVEAIKPHADAYVECVSTRGMPQLLRSRFSGEPVSVDYTRQGEALNVDTYNSYYPSPEMHMDATESLLGMCEQYVARP